MFSPVGFCGMFTIFAIIHINAQESIDKFSIMNYNIVIQNNKCIYIILYQVKYEMSIGKLIFLCKNVEIYEKGCLSNEVQENVIQK